MWFTHVSFGLVTFLSISYVSRALGLELFSELRFLSALLGSLLPDLDHPRSLISARLPLGGIVSRLSEHRGFAHTFEGALAICIPVGLLLAKAFADYLTIPALFVGYLSHLVADALTVTGVRWSWLKKGPRTSWRIRTGSLLELVVLFPSLMLGAYFFVGLYAPELASRDPLLGVLAALLIALVLTATVLKRGVLRGRRSPKLKRRSR